MSHVSLACRDLHESKIFYSTVLGGELANCKSDNGAGDRLERGYPHYAFSTFAIRREIYLKSTARGSKKRLRLHAARNMASYAGDFAAIDGMVSAGSGHTELASPTVQRSAGESIITLMSSSRLDFNAKSLSAGLGVFSDSMAASARSSLRN
jgi:catechol 2,3-dioxygenase-like lactoylglutathione lyase family enzyme